MLSVILESNSRCWIIVVLTTATSAGSSLCSNCTKPSTFLSTHLGCSSGIRKMPLYPSIRIWEMKRGEGNQVFLGLDRIACGERQTFGCWSSQRSYIALIASSSRSGNGWVCVYMCACNV
ncbi:hypothetical protein BGW80DRAFT_1379275 [Lactifluus volemus]|nr:hypothetical protein BGW80DRAFT_1379275 [Lactifluus volemus]